MAEQRTISLFLDATDKTELQATVGPELFVALGYLSTWNMTYPHVDIYKDGKTDLVAVYRNEDGSRGYTIGAIFGTHDGKYGFHS